MSNSSITTTTLNGITADDLDVIFVEATGTTADRTNVQAAIDVAQVTGQRVVLKEGTFNFSTGGVVWDDGPSDGSAAGFFAGKISGQGPDKTIINLGANQTAITYVAAGRNGQGGQITGLSIVGPNITTNTIGIQIGGVSTGSFDLHTRFIIDNIKIDNVRSAIIADDVSIFNIYNVRIVRAKYHYEWGYNIDEVDIVAQYSGHEQTPLASGNSCVITAGSNVITSVPTFVTDELQVGYAVSIPGKFPVGSYVGSFTSTTVTVVDFNGVAVNALANGTQCWFSLGRLFSFGNRVPATAGSLYPSFGSPFVSPYGNTLFPNESGRISATRHTYRGLANDMELIMDIGGGSHHQITNYMYHERFQRLARIGDSASNQQAFGITFDSNYLGQTQTVAGTPIVIGGASGEQNFDLTVKNSFSDGAALPYPWLRADGFFGNGRLTWERNNLPTASSPTVQLGSADVNFAAQPAIAYAGAMYLSSSRKGDAYQDFINTTWMYYGQDGMNVPLASGSRTLNLPVTYNVASRGKEFTLRITAQGSNTLTLGTGWLKTDGTDVGVIAAGTTGQIMEYKFVWTGSKFLAINTPVWVTP